MSKAKSNMNTAMTQPQVRQVIHPITNLSSNDVETGLGAAWSPWVANSVLHVRVPTYNMAKDGYIIIKNEIPNNNIQYTANYTDKPVQLHTHGKTTLGSMPAKYPSGHLVGSTIEIHIDAAKEPAKILLNGGTGIYPKNVDPQNWVKANDYTALTKIVGACKVYVKSITKDQVKDATPIDLSHVQFEQGAELVGEVQGFDA